MTGDRAMAGGFSRKLFDKAKIAGPPVADGDGRSRRAHRVPGRSRLRADHRSGDQRRRVGSRSHDPHRSPAAARRAQRGAGRGRPHLLSEVGYERLPSAEVARRCGVSEATVYRDLPTERELLVQVAQGWFAEVLAALEPGVTRQGHRGHLRAAVRRRPLRGRGGAPGTDADPVHPQRAPPRPTVQGGDARPAPRGCWSTTGLWILHRHGWHAVAPPVVPGARRGRDRERRRW